MIIATVAAILLFFGASDSDGLFGTLMTKYAEDPIKNTILDEARRGLALEKLSVLKDDINEFNKQSAEDIEQFSKLIKNYESSPEDFNKLFSSMMTKRQEEVSKIWDARGAMLEHIQPEEWKTIISSAKTAAQAK